MTVDRPRLSRRLAPYQKEFLHRIGTEAARGTVHVLRAPVGSGKSFVLAGAMANAIGSDSFRRILVLSPAAVTAQWPELLKEWGQDASAIEASALRLLREQLETPSDWPAGVSCMSFDLAKREDTRRLLFGVDWDMIVVDEAHQLRGQRLSLVQALIDSRPSPALILASHDRCPWITAFSARSNLIDWTDDVSRLRVSRSGEGAPITRHTVAYRRGEAELAIAEHLKDLARTLGPTLGLILLRQAASSVSCLEVALVQLSDNASAQIDAAAVEAVLLLVEELQEDAKLECFREVLAEVEKAQTGSTVVFCDYRATLEYLAAAVKPASVFTLDKGMTREAWSETTNQFRASGGLLITTAAATKGFSVDFVEAVIHYDLPVSAQAYAARLAQYQRYGREVPCRVFFFEDETGSLPLEDLQLRIAAKVEDIGQTIPEFDLKTIFQRAVGSS